MDISFQKNKNLLPKLERIDPSYYFKKVHSICFKKCCSPESLDGVFSIAEKSCLERCVLKFQEAEEFGYETFQYYKLKVKQAQIE